MSAPANRWKLGLFIVVGTICIFGAAVFFGTRSLRKETVDYASYFDESVTGLDIGSPVRFRGVSIGSVSAIELAPDRRHVQITYQLGVSVLGQLGLAIPGRGQLTRLPAPPDLRAQLGSSGITGVKYISIDFFEIRSNPAPVLPFAVAKNYIPAAPSTMKNLEASVVRAVDKFPKLAENLGTVLLQVGQLLTDIDAQKLPRQLSGMIVNSNRTLDLLQVKLNQVKTDQLSRQTQTVLTQLSQVIVSLNRVTDGLGGEHGVLMSVQRASDGMGDIAASARESAPELADTMRDVRETMDSVRRLADTLELDSDMLLKGRANAGEP